MSNVITVVKNCAGCGAEYETTGDRRGRPRSSCWECSPWIASDMCGTWAGWKRHHRAGTAACDDCLEASRTKNRDRYEYEPKPKSLFVCGECGDRFWSAWPHASYCSGKCRNRFKARNRVRSRDGRDKYRRLTTRVLDRDRWICQLCSTPIEQGQVWDFDDYWANAEYPSVDHILPRAAGGGDDIGNLQAAHLRCNLDKGEALRWA